MKQCPHPHCKQVLGEGVAVCPSCGNPLDTGLDRIDDYVLLELIGETSSGVLYRARRDQDDADVLLRLHPENTVLSEDQARRMNQELEAVSALSPEHMVRHMALRRSEQGRWYRVSEWIAATTWGDLKASRFFRDPRNKRAWIDLFIQMAEPLRILHEGGRIMPHLSLNDLILYKGTDDQWKIKLDYKLAPAPQEAQQPRSSSIHPDAVAGHPWDKRSDVWTLGRLMLTLLVDTDDIDDCRKMIDDIYQRFQPIVLHRKLSGLLRAMVEEDQEKRTTSMEIVLTGLRSITDDDIAKWDKFSRDPLKQKKVARSVKWGIGLAAGLVMALVISLFLYQRWQMQRETEQLATQIMESIQDPRLNVDAAVQESLSRFMASMEDMLPENRMAALAEQYRRSIALVLSVHYLEVDGKRQPFGHGTGTAFLVSSDGYLLTNRHVACLAADAEIKDSQGNAMPVQDVFDRLRKAGRSVRMVQDLYVWFDGDKAFRTLVGMGSSNPEDIFMLADAYHSGASEGQRKVEIVGVMPEPSSMVLERFRRSLGDDVAVLKVSSIPDGAVPIPLRRDEPGETVGAGTPVFVMGFPYGFQSITGDTAVSRQTNGIVTRVFDNAIAINADVHSGNSGGPLIDRDGFVVGIVTANYQGQSSMGYALPIQKAHQLLDAIHEGRPQWTGMPLYAVQDDLERARNAALAGDRDTAEATMKALLKQAPHPGLYLWAGILPVEGDRLTGESRDFLQKSLDMYRQNAAIEFLFYRDDFLEGKAPDERAFRSHLTALDWRSQQELFGYMVRILEGEVPVQDAVRMGDDPREKALLLWTGASVEISRGNTGAGHRHLQTASTFAEQETPLGFLVHAQMLQAGIAQPPGRTPPPVESRENDATGAIDALIERLHGRKKAAGASGQPSAESGAASYMKASFEHTTKGQWARALEQANRYLAEPRWESGNALSMGLLKCQLVRLTENEAKAMEALRLYVESIHDPWYRRVASHLMGQATEQEVRQEARGQEEILVLSTALGLQAEADGQAQKAVQHYNDALDTGLFQWMEFNIALARRNAIRASGN